MSPELKLFLQDATAWLFFAGAFFLATLVISTLALSIIDRKKGK